jgi:hypothetical protein
MFQLANRRAGVLFLSFPPGAGFIDHLSEISPWALRTQRHADKQCMARQNLTGWGLPSLRRVVAVQWDAMISLAVESSPRRLFPTPIGDFPCFAERHFSLEVTGFFKSFFFIDRYNLYMMTLSLYSTSCVNQKESQPIWLFTFYFFILYYFFFYFITVLQLSPYKSRSRVAEGVPRKRTLTAKNHEC